MLPLSVVMLTTTLSVGCIDHSTLVRVNGWKVYDPREKGWYKTGKANGDGQANASSLARLFDCLLRYTKPYLDGGGRGLKMQYVSPVYSRDSTALNRTLLGVNYSLLGFMLFIKHRM